MSGIAGLLLAAGTSSRMGFPKQLLQAGGKSLLCRSLEQALQSDLDHVVLVLGFRHKEITESLEGYLLHPKIQIIENRAYEQGISTSIIAGLAAVEEQYDHVMVLLADMPYVTSGLIDLLIHRYVKSRLPLGAIMVANRRSHPVIIGRPFYEELHDLKGDTGAKDIFSRNADLVCLVRPEEKYDDLDIDTEDDYLQFKKSLS